jgi:hypothetical protein
MSGSVTSVTSVSASSSSSPISTAGLTEDQKKKVLQIEADFAAKRITKAQQDQEIAKIRTETVTSDKKVQTTGNGKSAGTPAKSEESKNAEVTAITIKDISHLTGQGTIVNTIA